MAAIYARLIISGNKTISDVPDTILDKVKELLVSMGYESLTD